MLLVSPAFPGMIGILHPTTPTNGDREQNDPQPRQYNPDEHQPHSIPPFNHEIRTCQRRDLVSRDDVDGEICGKDECAQESVDDGDDQGDDMHPVGFDVQGRDRPDQRQPRDDGVQNEEDR